MYTKYITLLFLLSIAISSVAQFEENSGSSGTSSGYKPPKNVSTKSAKEPLSDRIVVGGGLDLRFGTITVIGLTPLVGYKASENLLLGGIFTYRYFQDSRVTPSYSTSTYGIAPFARYNIFRGLYAHVEYEALYGQWNYYSDQYNWITSFFVGGGYAVPIGDSGFMGVSVLWNLTEDPNYIIYNQPTLRMSFGVGL